MIFYRGEYLQLIDANQDNYLEECLKIRNVLGEFEEFNSSSQSPYTQWGSAEFNKAPVAIVGAREYIFSESEWSGCVNLFDKGFEWLMTLVGFRHWYFGRRGRWKRADVRNAGGSSDGLDGWKAPLRSP